MDFLIPGLPVSALIQFTSFSELVSCMHLCTCTRRRWSAHRTAGQSEGVRYRTVQLTDDFINPFLPAGVAVPPSPDGRVKLPQSHF